MASLFAEGVASGDISSVRPLAHGKNGALLVTYTNGARGVLKRKSFKTGEFRGVPYELFCKNEVAFFLLDRDLLRFRIAPETYETTYKGTKACVQEYVTGKTASDIVDHVFDTTRDDWKVLSARLLSDTDPDQVARLILTDIAVNNTDRHARNAIFQPGPDGSFRTGRLWGIDNGCSQGRDLRYYRNVFHKYMFLTRFPLHTFLADTLTMIRRKDLIAVFSQVYPTPMQAEATFARIKWVIAHKDDLSFNTLARGKVGPNDFPSWERELRALREGRPLPVNDPDYEMVIVPPPHKGMLARQRFVI